MGLSDHGIMGMKFLPQYLLLKVGASGGLTTLERRRSRGDLIEAYKIITGKEAVQKEKFFELAPNKATRGHRYKL